MTASGTSLPCPTCARPVALTGAGMPAATFPFCSSRCRLHDLAKWADGTQVIPGQPVAYDAYGPDIDQPPDDARARSTTADESQE